MPRKPAFYDALAGDVEHVRAQPALAAIAHELVENIRRDLTVDWTDRGATEAKIRAKIKRLLRRHRDTLAGALPRPASFGGGGDDGRVVEYYAAAILEQAKLLYRYWPEVESELDS